MGKHDSTGWNFPTLLTYINDKFAASDKAIIKAEMAADKRSDASNEIRAAMVDQQKNFADKVQTEFRFSTLEQRMGEISTILSTTSGKSTGIGASVALLLQVISAIVSVVAVIIVLRGH